MQLMYQQISRYVGDRWRQDIRSFAASGRHKQ